MRFLGVVILVLLSGCIILGQGDPLTVEDYELNARLDPFGH